MRIYRLTSTVEDFDNGWDDPIDDAFVIWEYGGLRERPLIPWHKLSFEGKINSNENKKLFAGIIDTCFTQKEAEIFMEYLESEWGIEATPNEVKWPLTKATQYEMLNSEFWPQLCLTGIGEPDPLEFPVCGIFKPLHSSDHVLLGAV